VRVALVYEEFRLDRSLARERVLVARALAERGIEVDVYCNPSERRAETPGLAFHDVRPLPRAPTRVGRAIEYGSFAFAATRELRANRSRYDIVDVAGTTAWEHDVIRAHAAQKAEQRRWPQRGGRGYRAARLRASLGSITQPRIGVANAIERLQFRPGRFKRVFAVTEEVKQDLQETLGVEPDVIDVISYPVETNRFATSEPGLLQRRLRLPPDEFVALFVGHDFERKGLGEALSGVGRAAHRITLVVVGEGDASNYIKRADELGIGDRVHFLGSTETPEMFFADADVFLLPSREDVWGVTVIEAMAAGVPVIVSEVAGAAEIVRETGAGIVVSGSADDVAHALGLLGNRDRARMVGERGRTAARRFDVARIADQIAGAYERIIAETRRRSSA
jgi:glycosyltransferase involved in cell wall biosynthesis